MKLGLGTVQFGIPYGVSNNFGQTKFGEVQKILQTAHENKIHLLDTATLYGDSEYVLGQSIFPNHSFKIVTKTPYFNSPQITSLEVEKLLLCVESSLKKLQQKNIYGVLFHNSNDVFCKNGEKLFSALQNLKLQNLISKIGFSSYNPDQIEQLLNYFEFDLIQVPINIFDQKLLLNGYLKKLKDRKVEIHARSIFLQGLLLMSPQNVPAYFSPVFDLIKKLHNLVSELKITPLHAAMDFVKSVKYLDYILIGVNNNNHLIENIYTYNLPQTGIDFLQFACFDERITNPSKWEIKK